MKILITNNTLSYRAGSELYVRDIAQALRARGHEPVAYSNILGEVAEEIKGSGVPVVDDLDTMPWTPDIIHGQHHLETMTALLRFPKVPAVYFCHGWRPWPEVPPHHPRIVRYIAVDDPTMDFAVNEHGVPPDRISVLLNFVDLDRFIPRSPLPEQPRKALILNNTASEGSYLPVVREACRRENITLETVGLGAGNPVKKPEDIIGSYDIVFAIARSALEALSVGTAVVLCGDAGVGPMVTSGNMERLRRLNFGSKALNAAHDPDQLVSQIKRYNAADAMEVSRRLRGEVGLDRAIESIIQVYRDVPGKAAVLNISEADEAAAFSRYLRSVSLLVKEKDRGMYSQSVLLAEKEKLLVEKTGIIEKKSKMLHEILDSATIRLKNSVVSIPVLGTVLRRIAALAKPPVK